MTFISHQQRSAPTGLSKALHFHWALAFLLAAIGGVGVLMLVSVAGGQMDQWAFPQLIRLIAGLCLMSVIAFVPIRVFRSLSVAAYLSALALLVAVAFVGETGMGARRWIEFGPFRGQPSELMKVTLVMILAWYYDSLPPERTSRPLWILPPVILTVVPAILVFRQPDLGTAALILMGGAVMMFIAGVAWQYFVAGAGLVVGSIATVFLTRGTDFQFLEDYQYVRIETFLNPSSDPLGAGYHITQSMIALGSGGVSGRGFMQGTQSRLNFLPEKHTDFIFTTLVEEMGITGGIVLAVGYCLIVLFCVLSALTNRNRYGSLLTLGIGCTFFLYFGVNMSMVMGLAPVVGVPLPLVSYGGSAMIVILVAFGLVQSAHVHKLR